MSIQIFSAALACVSLIGILWAFVSMITTKKIRMVLMAIMIMIGTFSVITYAKDIKRQEFYRVDNTYYFVKK